MALMLMIAFLLTSVVPTLTSTKRKRERSANSCRDCSGGRLCEKKCKSLAKLRPIIASEWHPTENGDLNPDDVSVGSHKKVWWQCPNPCDVCGELHDYSATINSRTFNQTGCPVCSSYPKQQCHNKCKSLAMVHPDIASQWHPTENELTPKDVFVSSNKKVWWMCPNPCGVCGEHHGYSAAICDRTKERKPTSCPICSSPPQQQCHNKCKSLAKVYPDIASQWHPTKNRDSPKDVFVGSGKKVWWLCPNPCDVCGELHEYSAAICDRTNQMNPTSCPICSSPSKQQCQNNCKSLAKVHPDIASEWHPTKNGDLTPDDMSVSSHKKVWWIKECKAGVFHEWPAKVYSRTKGGTCCPRCNESKGENAVLKALKVMGVSFLPQVSLYGHNNQKLKFDFGLLPEPSAYLEYDGEYHFTVHHSYKNRVKVGVKKLEDAIARDREKDDWIVNNGYTLLRIHFNDFDNIDSIVRDFIENLDRYKGSVVRSPNYVDCCVEELKSLLEQPDDE